MQYLNWIFKIPAAQATMICFPFAGGSSLYYRSWQTVLPKHWNLCAVNLPRSANSLIPELSSKIAIQIMKENDSPLILFGHSMGGLFAYEVAQALWRNYMMPPHLLAISACISPDRIKEFYSDTDLSDAAILTRIRSYQGTPEALLNDPECASFIIERLRQDLLLIKSYTFSTIQKLPCDIICFCGDNDPLIDIENCANWGELTETSFIRYCYPGGHFFINSHINEMISKINNQLTNILQNEKVS